MTILIPWWLEKYWKAALLSLLLSALFGLQHLIMVAKNGEDYNPLQAASGNGFLLEEGAYAANIKSAMMGDYAASDAHVEGKKGIVNSMEGFPNLVLGILSRILRLDIRQMAMLADFIFPMIAVWLYYLIGSRVLRMGKRIAFFTSLFIVILVHDITLRDIVWNSVTLNINYFLSFWSVTGRDMLTITRLIHPEFTILPMLLSIIFLTLSLSHERKIYPVLAGISAGVLAYSYFYYATFFWATFAALCGIMLLEGLWKKKWEKIVWGNLAIIGAIGSALSVPFAMKMVRNASLPQAQEILLRVGASFGREPNMLYIIAAMVLVPLLYAVYYNKNRAAFRLLSAAIIGGALLLNIQVVLGYTIQPDHWASRIVNPIVVLAIAAVAYEWLMKRWSATAKGIGIASIIGSVLLLSLLGFVQAEVAVKKAGLYVFPQGEKELYGWLNANTPKGSTVLTISIEQNQNLQLYTHNSIYWPNAMIHNLPTEEIVDRILSAYALFNVSEKNLWGRFKGNDQMMNASVIEDSGFVYYLFHFQFTAQGWKDTAIPDSLRGEISQKMKGGNFSAYDADYILVDPYSERFAKTSSIRKNYVEIYSEDGFSVFKAKTV